MKHLAFLFSFAGVLLTASSEVRADSSAAVLVAEGLLLDLDAEKGITVEDGNWVVAWKNQVSHSLARDFVKRDEGREEKGSGRPQLVKNVDAIGGRSTISFRSDELINHEEDVFDHLTTGSGYTWLAVMTPYEQATGVPDVNAFLGNLTNGWPYSGFWGALEDDNDLWVGSRVGTQRKRERFSPENPKVMGPRLQANQYYVVAARMGSGTGIVKIESFVDSVTPFDTADFPVDVDANASKLAIGTERDATNHPGAESFDGELARVLVYERSLSDKELQQTIDSLRKIYSLEEE